MKHRWILLLMVVVLVLSLVMVGCAEKQEKRAIFAWMGWTGNWLPAYVSKILLEDELGYTVEIVELSVAAAWVSIAQGDAHIIADSWLVNQEAHREKYKAETESLGIIYNNAIQGWMISKLVSEQYGITSTTDLKDPDIAKLFDIDGDGIGDLMGCDAGWGCAEDNDNVIAGYGLEALYEQKYGSEALMLAAIEGAMKKNEPVLFFGYTPYQLFVRYPLGESVILLDDPLDLWPEAIDVYKFANVEWIAENPKAAELLRQVEMTTVDVGRSMVEIEEKGDDPAVLEALTREWIAEHQAEVVSWLEAIK